MRANLVGLKYFKDFDNPKDSATLLMEIKAISYEYKGHNNPYLALDDAKTKLYSYHQKLYDFNILSYDGILCFRYQAKGHYRNKYPSGEHVQMLQQYGNSEVVPTETVEP